MKTFYVGCIKTKLDLLDDTFLLNLPKCYIIISFVEVKNVHLSIYFIEESESDIKIFSYICKNKRKLLYFKKLELQEAIDILCCKEHILENLTISDELNKFISKNNKRNDQFYWLTDSNVLYPITVGGSEEIYKFKHKLLYYCSNSWNFYITHAG